MKYFITLTLILFNLSFASTLEDLNITDEDFFKILHSPKKNEVLYRINDLMVLKKSLKEESNIYVKLNKVNDFFNEFLHRDDIEIYRKNDYWATRKEFIFQGAGDCEDFVIAKYFTLLELGIDESKLSLLHNLRKNQYHLVLAYQEDAFSQVLILDNIERDILPLTKRNDILVLYTLEVVDLSDERNISTNLQKISNYKWTKIYLKSKIVQEDNLFN